MKKPVRLLAALLLVGLSACASARTGSTAASPSGADVITAEQLRKISQTSLLQAVRALRPHWLSTRGTDTFGVQPQVVVYLDGQQYGADPSVLEQIPLMNVGSVQFFNPLEATARWGLCCGHGVIYVSSLRGGQPPPP